MFIKRYKGHNIYKLENGNYVFSILKTNIAYSYIDYSDEFPSIRKCKQGISYFQCIRRGKTK